MPTKNNEKDRLTSNITPQSLGKAMAQLDLSSIPPHRRQAAVMDHLMRIQADTIHDQSMAQNIQVARAIRSHLPYKSEAKA